MMDTSITHLSPSFTPSFHQPMQLDRVDEAGPSNSASPSREPTCQEEKNYTQTKYRLIDVFFKHEDFGTFKKQYTDTLNNIAAFVHTNGDKIKPPLTEDTKKSVENDLQLLKDRLFKNDGNAFRIDPSIDRRPFMYGTAKEMFHVLSRLLENENLPLQNRINAIVLFSPRAGACQAGIGADLQDTIRKLTISNAGLKGAAYKVKLIMMEQLIGEYVKKNHPEIGPFMEIHYVVAYHNAMSKSMGVQNRNDSIAADLLLNERKQCRECVLKKLKPINVVNAMDTDYLDRIEGAFLREGD